MGPNARDAPKPPAPTPSQLPPTSPPNTARLTSTQAWALLNSSIPASRVLLDSTISLSRPPYSRQRFNPVLSSHQPATSQPPQTSEPSDPSTLRSEFGA